VTLRYIIRLTGKEALYEGGFVVPIPVATRSKAWVCGRLLAGIVGSNPAVACVCCV